MTALRGESMVAFGRGLNIHDGMDSALSGYDVLMEVAVEFDNIKTIKRAIEVGAGVGLLPEPTVEREVAAGTRVKVRMEDQPLGRLVESRPSSPDRGRFS
jgi:DNA-binding transcriptional LysR family regulator